MSILDLKKKVIALAATARNRNIPADKRIEAIRELNWIYGYTYPAVGQVGNHTKKSELGGA